MHHIEDMYCQLSYVSRTWLNWLIYHYSRASKKKIHSLRPINIPNQLPNARGNVWRWVGSNQLICCPWRERTRRSPSSKNSVSSSPLVRRSKRETLGQTCKEDAKRSQASLQSLMVLLSQYLLPSAYTQMIEPPSLRNPKRLIFTLLHQPMTSPHNHTSL